MPEIKEYNPQTESQGAVGGVTPNLEAVSLFGRGLEHIGTSIDEASDVVHRRQAQEEISNTYGQFAQARADWNVKLKQGLKDGTLDPEKFNSDYADYINKIGDGVHTAEGKDFFNKQANRLGGTLMQNAITGKAQIAGQQAFDALNGGLQTNLADIHSNPEQGPDIMDGFQQAVDAHVATGTLNPQQARELKNQKMSELAQATIEGWAAKDPGQDDQGNPHENLAKQILDHTDDDGKGKAFDQYLSQQQRDHLYAYAKQQDTNRRVDQDNQLANAHRNIEMAGQNFMDDPDNATRILRGQMSTKEIEQMPGTLQQKEYLTQKLKMASMDESRTIPAQYNKAWTAINTGEVTTRQQIMDWPGLAPATKDRLFHEIDSTPDGQMVKSIKSGYDKMIDQGLRFKGVGGAYTGAGDLAAMNAKSEMSAQAKQFVDSGGGSARAYWSNNDPKDPTSPIAILNKYRGTMGSRMNDAANEAIQQTQGTARPPSVPLSNSPTKEVPPPQFGPQQESPAAPEPKAPERSVLDPNPNDTPDVAANRAKNKADLDAAMAAVDKIKNSDIVKGFSSLSIHSSTPKPQGKTPSDTMIHPGESIMDWKKRTGQ